MKNEKIPVTVLMPAFNAAAYINDAIESILAQSYIYFEFLIIDDGSTDETTDIIQSFSDPRIRLIIHDRNKGLKYTLNEGIELSSNELIARMDADDISHPWRIEKQASYMLAHPECALVDSWVKVMDKNKNYINTEGSYSAYTYYTLTFECCIFHSAVLYRKSCVQSVGGYQLEYAEDYDLFWRLSRIWKIHTIEEPLLWYRRHDQNLNTVVKKTEYDAFSQCLWKQNILYFTGKDITIPDEYISTYRYQFNPLLKEKNIKKVYDCMNLFEKISFKILSVENPNRNAEAIRFITNFKKNYIIKNIALQLPVLKMWRFLAHYRLLLQALKMTLKRIKL